LSTSRKFAPAKLQAYSSQASKQRCRKEASIHGIYAVFNAEAKADREAYLKWITDDVENDLAQNKMESTWIVYTARMKQKLWLRKP